MATGRNASDAMPSSYRASETGPVSAVELAKAIAVTDAPRKNHLSCCRSTPTERRNRSRRLVAASRKIGGAPALLTAPIPWIQPPSGSGGTSGGGATLPSPRPTPRGAVPRTVRLRPFQHAALAAFERTARPDFIAVATPGAGKTTFALAALRTVLAARPGRVVVVAPTAHLKLQWAHAGVRLGLQLEPGWTPAGGVLGGPAEQLSMFAALSAVASRESAAWSPWQEPLPDAWSDMTDPTIEIELGPLPRLGGVDA